MHRAKLEKRNSKLVRSVFTFLISLFCFLPGALAQAPPAIGDQEPVIESYYKIAPGKAAEWLELYRRQHLPILKERKTQGQILDILIYRPFLHQGGSAWDFKVILRYRDFTALGDRKTQEEIERRLYPDWAAHQQAEQRRWEITDQHWDDIMVEVAAEEKK
jgi:hypothetical protein